MEHEDDFTVQRLFKQNKNLEKRITELEINLADVFKEYQDLAGVHNATCVAKDSRITVLESVLRATRARLLRKGMTTLAIDSVLDKKGDL